MKKLIIITLSTMLCLAVSAQEKPVKKGERWNKTEKQGKIEKAIENRGEKMANKLMLDEETTAKFIPVYNAYLNDLTDGKDKNSEKLKKGKNKSDSEMDAAMQKRFTNSRRITDVREKYYNEFRKFLTPMQAKTALQKNSRNHQRFDKHPQFKKNLMYKHGKVKTETQKKE